jgi:hypothetical protein
MNIQAPVRAHYIVHEDVAAAIRIVDLEVRILNVLLAHSRAVGADEAIDDWQGYRVTEAIAALNAMIGEVAA